MSNTLSIALLLCDDVREELRDEFGSYLQFFSSALHDSDADIEITPFRANKGKLPDNPEAFDGYLISGSRHSVYEEQQWIEQLKSFVVAAYEAQRKVVGICFGHQIIAEAFGGKVEKAQVGWGLGVQNVKLTQQPAWLKSADNSYNINVVHQDQVIEAPTGFDVIASNDFCPVSALSKDNLIFSVQGHPEFPKAYTKAVTQMRRNILTDEEYQRARASFHLDPETQKINAWITDFLRFDQPQKTAT